MFLVSRLLPEFFVRLFTRDAAAVSVSVWGIHTFTLGIIPLSFQYVLVDGLTAMGRTKTALILSILRKGTYITAAVVLAVLAVSYTHLDVYKRQLLAGGTLQKTGQTGTHNAEHPLSLIHI